MYSLQTKGCVNSLCGFLDLDEMSDKASSEHGEEAESGEQGSNKASSPGSSSSMPLPSMLLERKIETLTTEWNKSPDMLFTIHPIDGSFLVWHVKYLDEFNQGIFRQVQVGKAIQEIEKKKQLLCKSQLKSQTLVVCGLNYQLHIRNLQIQLCCSFFKSKISLKDDTFYC